MKQKVKAKVTVSLRLDEQDKQIFERICAKMKSNKSEVARDLLKSFIHKLNLLK